MANETPQDRLPEQSQPQVPDTNQVSPTGSFPARIGDAERSKAIRQIQRAMATGHLEFDEIGDRFEKVYRAQTKNELEPVVADLPPLAAAPPAHPAPLMDFKLVGDTKRGGLSDVGEGYTCINVIGDIRLDLTSLDFSRGDVNVTCWSAIGDVKIIVPDGVRVQRGGVTILGDGKEALVPPVDDAPLVKVEIFQLIGDTKIYSLSLVPEGRLRKWWRKLRTEN